MVDAPCVVHTTKYEVDNNLCCVYQEDLQLCLYGEVFFFNSSILDFERAESW